MEDNQGSGQTRVESRMRIRDVRELPTVTVTKEELSVIAEHFPGRALPIARSMWQGFVQLADGSAEVVATRREVGDVSGVSKRVVDEYVPRFVDAGMLGVTLEHDAKGKSLPSTFVLLGVQQRGRGTALHPPSSSSPNTATDGEDEERRVQQPHPSCWEGLPTAIETDARAFLKAKRREHGRVVTEEEMLLAAHALAAFNKAQGAEHGLGANLPKLVARIRERPSWDAAKWVRLVESAWRLKWWEKSGRGRRPTPAVVFGNANVLEQVAMDAAQEAAGETIADTPERRSRFSRTVDPE